MTSTTARFGIRPEHREGWYRFASGVVALLLAFGYLREQEAALWTQLAISTVTLLFAALFATSTWRQVLYPVLGAGGALLMAYGIVSDEQWALILPAVAQLFGLSTAAAKVVQLPPRPGTSPPLAA